jgi:hypothetical protein
VISWFQAFAFKWVNLYGYDTETGGEHDFEGYYAASELCAANEASVKDTELIARSSTDSALSRQGGGEVQVESS